MVLTQELGQHLENLYNAERKNVPIAGTFLPSTNSNISPHRTKSLMQISFPVIGPDVPSDMEKFVTLLYSVNTSFVGEAIKLLLHLMKDSMTTPSSVISV